MRVTLINARGRHSQSPVLPLGLVYLGAVLDRDGHTVQLIDQLAVSLGELCKQVFRFEPDVVGISTVSLNMDVAIKTSKLLRKKLSVLQKKIYFCAGGVHPTIMPEDAAKRLNADFVVIGEGETTLSSICSSIEANGGELDLNKFGNVGFFDANGKFVCGSRRVIENLGSFPMPSYKLIDMEAYLRPPGFIRGMIFNRPATIVSSRGCPFSCTYCSSSAMFQKKTRFHSVEYVVSQLKYLKREYGIDSFFFMDETFTLDKKRVLELCTGFKEIGLPWGCGTRVELIDWEMLKAMRNSGCVQIEFGVESGSQEIRNTMRRGQTRKMIEDAFTMCKKLKIKPFAQVMVGCPGETKQQVNETINLLKTLKPAYTFVSVFTPLPSTEVFNTYKDVLGEDYISRLSDYDMADSDHPLVNVSKMADEEIIKARAKILRSVFRYNYSSVLTPKHFWFFCKCLGTSFFYFRRTLTSIKKAISEQRVEYILFTLVSNYTSWYKLKKPKKLILEK